MTLSWPRGLCGLAIFLCAKDGQAHVNWFAENHTTASGQNSPVPPNPDFIGVVQPPYSFAEVENLWALLAAALILVAANIVNRLLPKPVLTLGYRLPVRKQYWILRGSDMLLGYGLLVSALNATLLAPHLVAQGVAMALLIGLQAAVAILLIGGAWTKCCGLALLLLHLMMTASFGTISGLEYLNFLGLGLILFARTQALRGAPRLPPPNWAITALRLCLGLSLITLGLTEKLLDPNPALTFLHRFGDINFMAELGLPFSDRLFIFCCGTAEILFGVIFLTGWVTRLNTIALAVFLIASNSYFFIQGHASLAMMEAAGHAPLFAGALILLVWGKGCPLPQTSENSQEHNPTKVDKLANPVYPVSKNELTP